MSRSRLQPRIERAGAAPRGPQIDDEAHERLFSETSFPDVFIVNGPRVVLFDAKGEPLTRRIGFK